MSLQRRKKRRVTAEGDSVAKEGLNQIVSGSLGGRTPDSVRDHTLQSGLDDDTCLRVVVGIGVYWRTTV